MLAFPAVDRLTVPAAPLSRRQAEVLALKAQGLTVRQIAAQLGIGRESVRTHLTKLKRRYERSAS